MQESTVRTGVSLDNTSICRGIEQAAEILEGVVRRTPLEYNQRLSEKYEAHIYLKREDLQIIRSFKLRGAYNKIYQLTPEEKQAGVICASAGNHAQGFAYACRELNIHGKVYMPTTTPKQKISKVRFFGRDNVEVIIEGDTYDDAYNAAMQEAQLSGRNFVHPFNDDKVIQGQGTIASEIIKDIDTSIDYCLMTLGGGGMSSGVSAYFKTCSPNTQLLAIEPSGAPAMHQSFAHGKVIKLPSISTFVDGAAVRMVGDITYDICRRNFEEILLVEEGHICSTILELYNEDAIVLEPAGALAVSALDLIKEEVKGKTVVCIVSGGNNDITRMEDFKEKSLIYQGLKHYFIITFPQRAGALREFLNQVLGPNDDITLFEYTKKTSRESGPAIVGIELRNTADYEPLIARMHEHKIRFQTLNDNKLLFDLLI